MGAGGFHGRVRDGIGCSLPAKATRSSNPPRELRFVLRGDRCGRFWCVYAVLRVLPDMAVILVWMTAVQGGIIEPIGRLGPVS